MVTIFDSLFLWLIVEEKPPCISLIAYKKIYVFFLFVLLTCDALYKLGLNQSCLEALVVCCLFLSEKDNATFREHPSGLFV